MKIRRRCDYCRHYFQCSRKDARFCSSACRKAASRARTGQASSGRRLRLTVSAERRKKTGWGELCGYERQRGDERHRDD